MYLVKFSLQARRGRLLWEQTVRVSDSGQMSLGRSQVCDLFCPFFASSEWILLSIINGFISLSDKRRVKVGLMSCCVQFRRDRMLTCTVVESEDKSIFKFDQLIDFSCPRVLEHFPAREFFFDQHARAVTADVLMQDDVFDPMEKSGTKIKPSQILSHLFLRVDKLLSEELSPRAQLRRVIDCFMMIVSYVYAVRTLWAKSCRVSSKFVLPFVLCNDKIVRVKFSLPYFVMSSIS